MIKYKEEKATQAAARLIFLSNGKINHMKLIKLLYFADRRALLTWGRPITFDWYVSMQHGPVLSFTLDKINDIAPGDGSSYWHRYISERSHNEVSLLQSSPPNDQLSKAEEKLLNEVWNEFGRMTEWQLRDFSHTLPEWRDPQGSRLPIEIKDIFLSEGLTESDYQEAMDALDAETYTEDLIGE